MANAAGAFYLSIINTICIAFATLIGAMFIMEFRKKQYVDQVKELHNAEAVIAQQHALINELEQKLQPYTKTGELAPLLLRDVKVLFPHVESLSVSRGTTAVADSTMERMFIILSSETPISNLELENITKWFKERTGEDVVVRL